MTDKKRNMYNVGVSAVSNTKEKRYKKSADKSLGFGYGTCKFLIRVNPPW